MLSFSVPKSQTEYLEYIEAQEQVCNQVTSRETGSKMLSFWVKV